MGGKYRHGWLCTECGGKTRVMDSRCRETAIVPHGQMVRRRRQCTSCFKKLTTCEIVFDEKHLMAIEEKRRKLVDLARLIIEDV